MFKLIKKYKKTTVLVIFIIMVAGYFVYKQMNKNPLANYTFAVVERGDVVQKVSVTGKVEAVDDLKLAFEMNGKVARVNVKVGEKVSSGKELAALSNADLSAQVLQAAANYEAEQARLQELQKGARPEEIVSLQIKIENAKRTLADAEGTLVATIDKATTDLDSDYNTALAKTQEGVSKGKSALLTLTDIQQKYFGSSLESQNIIQQKSLAIEKLLGGENAGLWSSYTISTLVGGAYGLVQECLFDPERNKIDNAMAETLEGLQYVQSTLNAIPIISDMTATELANLAAEKTNVTNSITTLISQQQTISVQKSVNQNNINSSQSSVTSAKNSLANAENDLDLKLAGSTQEQIAAQAARAKAALGAWQSYRAQLEKTIIRSPISGMVTLTDIKVGELISANTKAIEVISDSAFQIEVKIPEVDVSKIKIGDVAQVTLDAYGEDVKFVATVAEIDLAETLVEGVPTYKTILLLDEPNGLAKSGMTANVDIETNRSNNVLHIPQRAVISRDNSRFVRRLADSNTIKEVEIKLGIKGSNREVEIDEGLNEGDKIVLFEAD